MKSSNDSYTSKMTEEIRKTFNNQISRNQEDLYQKYENDFLFIYKKILTQENLLFLEKEKEEDYTFKLHHLLKITQYMFHHFYSKSVSEIKKLNPKDALELKRITPPDVSALKDSEYYNMIYYLVSQYFRTLKM